VLFLLLLVDVWRNKALTRVQAKLGRGVGQVLIVGSRHGCWTIAGESKVIGLHHGLSGFVL